MVRGFHARVNGTVRAISVFDGKVFIGGNFTKVNGTPRAHLAALGLTDGRLAASPNIRVDGPVYTSCTWATGSTPAATSSTSTAPLAPSCSQ